MDRWKNEEEIKNRIAELARVYTPEWEFTEINPDAGSVIALIFAEQLKKREEKFAGSLARCRMGLINMLGISLRPAVPAEGVVAMETVSGISSSVQVPAGSRFLAENGEGEMLVFETKDSFQVSPSRMTELLGISRAAGKVTAWKGDRSSEIIPGVLLCFQNFISQPGECLRLKTGIIQTDDGADTYEFLYYTKDGFRRAEPVLMDQDTVEFQLEPPPGEITFEGAAYKAILIRHPGPVRSAVTAGFMGLAATGTVEAAEYTGWGEQELTGEWFYPFGERIGLYEEFYVGSSGQFGRSGAKISLSFSLSYEDRDYSYTGVEESFELKPIRRKPAVEWKQNQYQCRAEAVALEYYNGTGWRCLVCDCDTAGLFDGDLQGKVHLSFVCPKDWEDASSGGYEGKLLRFRITRAEYCYMLPCRHRIPVITGLEIRSSYEGIWREPDRVLVYGSAAGEMVEMTGEQKAGRRIEVFSPLPWKQDCLYLGFDRKFTEGPVSFYIKLREDSGFAGMDVVYSYSALNGFRQLETVDHTGGLTTSDTVMFMPPADMAETAVAGRRGFWIRMEDARGEYPAGDLYPAVIEDIIWNSVSVRNIETRTEEDYYLETPAPDMEFFLGQGMILDAEVYVNEKNSLSAEAMRQLQAERPKEVRAETDTLGEFQEFFVRWQETEDFCHSGPLDRHYVIDRVNHVLRFGNGIHGKIPGEKNGTAFTAALRCCNGGAGNVAANEITMSSTNLMFLERIYNPDSMSGGNDMENLEHACERGTAVLNSRNRLVSRQDYIREALGYSNLIDKVSCMIGETPDGAVVEGRISLVLLMKDYRDGSGSFHQMQKNLKGHLLERCEAGIGLGNLVIQEPVFVKIHTEIWVEIRRPEAAFEIQDQILAAMEQFLEPVAGLNGKGWDIGVLPKESQILRMLQSLQFEGRIRHLLVSAECDGKGETELSSLRENPFEIGMNGSHRIHISLPEEMGGRL